MALDAVLLDVGGVFHLPDPERILLAATRAEVDVPAERIERAHYAGAAAMHGDGLFTATGEFAWRRYLDAYAAELCADPDARPAFVEELAAEFTTMGLWSHVVTDAVDALADLAATGVKLAIVSNADGTVADRLREQGVCQVGPGMGTRIDAVIDSGAVGVEKPDPRIFRLALDALAVAPERTVHVGDIPAADADGARAAGIQPVLMDPYGFCAAVDPAPTVASLREVVALVADLSP